MLRILAYHRILSPPADFPLDPGVISATTEGFREQMEFVREYFTAISFSDLARIVTTGATAPPNPIIITFDDGYRDNYTNAFPILRELGLPAAIFLVTGHIGTAQMFWWDKIVYVVHQTQKQHCSIDLGDGEKTWLLMTPVDRKRFREAVLFAVKFISERQKSHLINHLMESLLIPSDYLQYAGELLTWDHVREMSKSNIEFGSHTRTHPILANITEEQLEAEVAQSRADIVRETGLPPLAIAYPVGGAEQYNPAVMEAARKSGYQFGVAYHAGINKLGDLTRFALRRISIDAADDFDSFVSRVAFDLS